MTLHEAASSNSNTKLIEKRLSEVGLNTPEAMLMRAIFSRALEDATTLKPKGGLQGLTITEIGRAAEYLCGDLVELARIDIDPAFAKKLLSESGLRFNYYGAMMSYSDLVIVVKVAEHRMESMIDARDFEMARRRLAFRQKIAEGANYAQAH